MGYDYIAVKVNYNNYSLTATTTSQFLEIPRASEYIRIKNFGDSDLKVVIRTSGDRDANFSSSNKVITVVALQEFSDKLQVEGIYYKTDSGTANFEVYVSY